MASRSKYSKVQQANGASGPYDFGHQCIYNRQLKVLFVSAPSDRYDSTGGDWIASGSGSVFVYSYDEVTTYITQIQKISQPNVNTDGIASKRHALARFGQSIDTYGDWLIIGCPGDIYTEKHDGTNVVRNDQYTTDQNISRTTAAAGSVYFYKWNGSTFDYVNKVVPPLYQDFANPVSEFNAFNSQRSPYYERNGIYCGNGSAFGSSVSVDQSDMTSYSSANIRTRKLVAVGAPNAVCSHLTTGNYRGPFGGVWILSYDTTTLKWRLFSEKLTHYSFGGRINSNEYFNGLLYGMEPNLYPDQDGLGIEHLNSSYTIYRSNPIPIIIPAAASDSRATASTFGERVSIGYYGANASVANHKLVVYDSAGFSVQDSRGKLTRGGNTYFYDLVHTPANPEEFSLVMRSPYVNRQEYLAQDKITTANAASLYADSISGYSTFCDAFAGPDGGFNIWSKPSDPTKNVARSSAGSCPFRVLTTDPSTATGAFNNLFKSGSIGSHDIKQAGRLCFVSVTGLIRIYPNIVLRDSYLQYAPYSVDYYDIAYSGTSGQSRVVGQESVDCILVFDISDLNSLHTKGWLLMSPNPYFFFTQTSEVDYSGGFGRHFDVYQESSTSWVVASSCLTEQERQFDYPFSPSNDYIYSVMKTMVKTHLHRITYDGSLMSASLINTVSGKTIDAGGNGFPTYDFFRGSDYPVTNSNGQTMYVKDLVKHIGIPTGYNFISTALINNVTRNEYHVAEGWAGDNDGSTNQFTRTGSLNLTVSESYDINPSAFLAFCE